MSARPPARHIVVVNLHGGLPSCYITASVEHLLSLRVMRHAGCTVHTRMYPTNACASAALHGFVMGSSPYQMLDACHFPWSGASGGRQPSIFQSFKDRGYTTHLVGCYGLDAALDPRTTMSDATCNMERRLAPIGIDHFDVQDGEFAYTSAEAYDGATLDRAHERVRGWDPQQRHFMVVNLLCCRDFLKWRWRKTTHPARVPVVSAQQFVRADDANVQPSDFSPTVADDPRAGSDESRMAVGTKRLAMLSDYLQGCASSPSDDTYAVLSAMQREMWAALIRIDNRLSQIVKHLLADASAATAVMLMCTRALSLCEHAVMADAPWDACTRGFVAYCTRDTRARGTTISCALPCSIRTAHDALFSCADASPPPAWHARPHYPESAVTISMAHSNACCSDVPPSTDVFACPYMWARVVTVHKQRLMAIVYWWSIADMVRSTFKHGGAAWNQADTHARAREVESCGAWKLPIDVLRPDAVYDMSADGAETCNLAASTDWLASAECASLTLRVSDVLMAYALLKAPFVMKVPYMLSMTVDALYRSAAPLARVRHVHVQTEPTAAPAALSGPPPLRTEAVDPAPGGRTAAAVVPAAPPHDSSVADSVRRGSIRRRENQRTERRR